MTEHDYSNYQEDPEKRVGYNGLARLQGLAQEQLNAEARVTALEEQLAEAKAVYNRLRLTDLPNLMDELELPGFTMKSGVKLEMGEEIRASIPKGREGEAFAWLEDRKEGGLIKREIKIEFGKGDEKWADKFERDCAQRKKPLNLSRKKHVHFQTLQAFVKGQLREGVDIPQDVFGVFRQRFAKVILPKK